MKKLEMGINKFPDLFVCETNKDVQVAKENGLPYIIWRTGDHDKLMKLVLYHLVCKMLPEIDWKRLWGLNARDLEWCQDGSVCIETSEARHEFNVDDYLLSNDAHVNIEELESLHLLPAFLGDITDVIRQNITDYTWHDGRNKKTGLWMGNYNPQHDLPNLVILDISHSIPVGISSVMIRLIDTIRNKCNAELIITGGRSYYWGINDPLPTPQEIRDMIPRANESIMFQEILKEKVAGRHWGNIISFGDGDCPYWSDAVAKSQGDTSRPGYVPEGSSNWMTNYNEFLQAMQGTEVEMVYHYHKYDINRPTGYAKWARAFKPKEAFDNKWCSYIKANDNNAIT